MSESRGRVLNIPGFRDVSVIGHGASSTVYRAHDVELTRPVAIKVLLADDPEDPARKRFKREGVITANLGRHPHIVQLLGTGFTADGHPYVVMELFEQGSIADHLRTAGTFGVAETLDIGAKVADAVSAAHRAGVLHRDIKPQNVLLSEYGPALGDFGIARTSTNLEWSQSLDQLTPMHAAPEILSGGTSTIQSDVYSLGSTLYTMLSGRPPFAGPPGEAPLRYQIRMLQEPIPLIPRADVPTAVREVLERALAKSPEERFTSAADLRDALEAEMRSLVARTMPGAAGEKSTEGRHRWATLAQTQPESGGPNGEERTVSRLTQALGTQALGGAGDNAPTENDDDGSTIWPEPSMVPSLPSTSPPPAANAPPISPRATPALSRGDAPSVPVSNPRAAQVVMLHTELPPASMGGSTDAVAADEGAFTVHRPIESFAREPEPGPPVVRRRVSKTLLVVIASVVLLGAAAGAIVLLHSPHPSSISVGKTHTVTTTDADRPSDVTLTRTATGASLHWTATSSGRLHYLVIEVTTRGNKILGTTAAGATALVVPGVEPTDTTDCFEVTAVISATTVGAPASWCPVGESVSGA